MTVGEPAPGGDANVVQSRLPNAAQPPIAPGVPQSPAAVSPVAILRVGPRGRIMESNVADARIRRVTEALRAPWYRDRWGRRELREAALSSLNTDTPGGLVLIGPRMRFETPPPFHEFFEPIELTQIVLGDNPGLKALSGDAPTREERQSRVLLWILGPFGAIFAGFMLFIIFFGPIAPTGRLVLLGTFTFAGFMIFVASWLLRLRGHWFLIPGGVAIVTRYGKARERLRVYTRHDAVPVLRYVNSGKATIRTLALLTSDGRRPSMHITERQAIALLAAWQSDHATPSRAELFDVLLGAEYQNKRQRTEKP